MGVHKKNLSDYEVEMEGIVATEKITKSINSKVDKKAVEKDRSIFLLNLIEMDSLIESQRRKGYETALATKSKNVLQSLAYLILNDIFYSEIAEIRKMLEIPEFGYLKENKETGKSEEAYKRAQKLVEKYNLCNKNDLPKLTKILMFFLLYQMDFNRFFQSIAPMILEKEKDPIIAGLDTKVKEYENSEENFFTCQWHYKLYPFITLTNLGDIFEDFVSKELTIETNADSYEQDYVDFLSKKFDVYKNKQKIKEKENLELSDRSTYVLLIFTTTFFTEPKDISVLYKSRLKDIQSLIERKEADFKKIQKKYLSEQFERNNLIARLRKRNLTYDEVSAYMHYFDVSLDDDYRNKIKVEWAKFNGNVEKALKRKIIF